MQMCLPVLLFIHVCIYKTDKTQCRLLSRLSLYYTLVLLYYTAARNLYSLSSKLNKTNEFREGAKL